MKHIHARNMQYDGHLKLIILTPRRHTRFTSPPLPSSGWFFSLPPHPPPPSAHPSSSDSLRGWCAMQLDIIIWGDECGCWIIVCVWWARCTWCVHVCTYTYSLVICTCLGVYVCECGCGYESLREPVRVHIGTGWEKECCRDRNIWGCPKVLTVISYTPYILFNMDHCISCMIRISRVRGDRPICGWCCDVLSHIMYVYMYTTHGAGGE